MFLPNLPMGDLKHTQKYTAVARLKGLMADVANQRTILLTHSFSHDLSFRITLHDKIS